MEKYDVVEKQILKVESVEELNELQDHFKLKSLMSYLATGLFFTSLLIVQFVPVEGHNWSIVRFDVSLASLFGSLTGACGIGLNHAYGKRVKERKNMLIK